MARLAVYGAISTVLASGVIANAFAQRSNFYAACIYLYRSNACMMILLNLGLFLTIIAGQLVQIIFFGNLRALEVEMEQSPEIPLSFHIRIVSMITILVSLDILLVLHAMDMVALRGPNMMIMFGFEYTLLATSLMASFGKYVLHMIDMRSEEPWENKSMLLFYLDLVADFVKLVTYLLFFMVILVCYGLPLHIIRDVYMTMRSFLQKCKDLIQYRKATRNMNERYPDASVAELAALSDPICIICREEMVGTQPNNETPADPAAPLPPRNTGSSTNVPKKLPCGHIFHFHCLKSWLERQQSCPTCRRPVLDPPTPTPTPTPAAAGEAGQGAGQAPAPAPGQQGGAIPGFGNFGNNNGQAPPGLNGGNQVVGYPVFAPQGHFPLAGWHHQAMAGAPLPGALPQGGAQAGTGSGTSTATPGAGANSGAPGAIPNPPFNHIPHFSIPNVMHPIPGFIPLFPVGAADAAGAGRQEGQTPNVRAAQQAGQSAGSQQQSGVDGSQDTSTSAGATSSRPDIANLIDQTPLTPLDSLSEEQLSYLEENTRRGLQERLRVLQAIEVQIAQTVGVLNRVLGAFPAEGIPIGGDATDPASPTAPSNGSLSDLLAKDRMFGNGAGPTTNSTPASQVGLQSLSRTGLARTDSNGEGTSLHNSSTSTFTTTTSTTTTTTTTTNTSSGEARTANLAQETVQGPQSCSDATNSHQQGQVDKGKGRKSDADLEPEAHEEVQEEDDEDDSKYTPQEMVRRRWTKANANGDASPSSE
ncbi:E3 ubiquitin-protein ligase hrd1 [Mortierella sp. GBA43]|nr:E3 ubiquitin-protein ligase hrd1 [Mortierella sp. GBA43]